MAYSPLLLFSVMVSLTLAAGPAPPYNLQCEHNFVGLSEQQLHNLKHRHHFATENPNPLLSWTITHSERGATQKAFKVQVTSDVGFKNIVWDTGVVSSDLQEIEYRGPPLDHEELYLWNITWWDHHGIPSESLEVGHFLAVGDLNWNNVSWITSNVGLSNANSFVRKVDLTGKKVSKAVLYVSGLGYFRAFVNGHDLHRMSDPPIFLAPGWTNYEVRIGYLVFDVTELTKNNPQVELTVKIGEGWRNKTAFPPHDALPVPDIKDCVLRAQFQVDFSDGSESMIVKTDSSWDVTTSNITFNSVYDGEIYNASIDTRVLGKASETPGPAGSMYLANIPPIVETGIYDTPQKIYRLQSDSRQQIVDFGINHAGIVNINVEPIKSGEVISMRHAEVLTHPPYGPSDGSLFLANLRGAEQLDVYTSSGAETNYQPTFTYHGFRYVAVTNYPRDLKTTDMKRIRISTNLKSNSKFNSSVALFNNIQENVILGQVSNMMTIPTDCDQRTERLGWMGDVGLSADSMAMNFHMEAYFPHRTLIIEDEEINGSIPDVTPFYHGGGRPADPSWSEAYPQIVWVLMKQYGDMNTAREFYASLIRYIDFMETLVPANGIGGLQGRYGDWCPPPEYKKIDNHYPSAFSLMLNIQQMQEIAQALGETADKTRLSELFSKHVDEFNKAFLSNGMYMEDMQVSYALPLFLDIVPEESYAKVSSSLVNKLTTEDRYHISAGIIGTKFILPALTKIKQNSVGIEVLKTVDYPSYGYMIHNPYEPATTIWELWNSFNGSSGMDSRNHHMFSSVSGWMQTDMIGFQQVEGTYGYEELNLFPANALDLSAASIQLDYPKPVRYSYHRRGGIQCGKAAEDQSSINPGLPKHDGLVISCGEGVISEVKFASYGNPTGVCGYHQYGSCHSVKSLDIVEKECLHKSECRVQTDGDFWGDPCSGQMDVKWLTVAVLCKDEKSQDYLEGRYSSLKVDVSVPMKSKAHLHIPAHGLSNVQVWDGEELVYSDNRFLETNGILSVSWILDRDLLKLDLISGDYSFTVRGHQPEETQMLITRHESKLATLSCSNSRRVISKIDWVSYGDPSVDRFGTPRLGTYHSVASQMIVENECLGKSQCNIAMENSLFFAGTSFQFIEKPFTFAVKYSCNYRPMGV